MKNYTITVNGTVYDVTVEEGAAGSAASAWIGLQFASCSFKHLSFHVKIPGRLAARMARIFHVS